MPDETTSVDTQAPDLVEPVTAEPTTVAEPEPVAVVESVIVAEQPVVAENIVAVELAPVVDAPVGSIVVEPVTAVEQPAPIAQDSAVPQSGDLGLTPQQRVVEALKPEIVQEIPLQKPESTPVVAPSSSQQATAPCVYPVAHPLGFFVSLAAKAHLSTQARKRNKLDRIMGLFVKQASITNDDAEKLLHISDATACRYLGILEKEGKIKQFGTAGRWVSYAKV